MVYKFLFEGGSNNSYYFETNNGCIYEIRFKPTPYLFENESKEIRNNVFEFAILLEYNPNVKLPSKDKNMGATVVAVFIDFYKKIGNAASIYISILQMEKNLLERGNLMLGFQNLTMKHL
ncbi:MAG: hypothetical protein HC854_17455 [Flavobacterium sp.]|nr:hypothetical protein [Flavobacterium sp.]